MLAPPDDIVKDKKRLAVFTNNADKAIPNIHIYSQWWSQADEKRQRLAVGSRRFSLVANQLDKPPTWSHFVDPETGELLDLDFLSHETAPARAKRLAAVNGLVARAGADISLVATYGF